MIDLSLDADAQEIVTAVTDLLVKAAPLDRLRQPGSEGDLRLTLAEFGWFAMARDADAGGMGLGLAEQALIHVEAGRRLLAPSAVATVLAAQYGPSEMRAGFADGSLRAGFAVPAGRGRFVAVERSGSELLLVIEGDALRFFGTNDFVGEAVEAFDENLEMQSGTIGTGPLVEVAQGDRAALLVAALLAGAASGAAVLAIEHAKAREQFGQPIGAFQAVKHRCADMGVAAFAAEAQVVLAAAAIAEDAPCAPLDTAAAVLQAIKAARANGAAAIQVHGGMGFTAECHAHRFLKRGQVLIRLLGGERAFSDRMLSTA